MKAYRAAVYILIDPRVVGPEASTPWKTRAAAADWMSALLSENKDVLDWAYVGTDEATTNIEVSTTLEEVEVGDPMAYEEGSFV